MIDKLITTAMIGPSKQVCRMRSVDEVLQGRCEIYERWIILGMENYKRHIEGNYLQINYGIFKWQNAD